MISLLFCGAGEPLMTTQRERIEDGWRTFYAEVRAKHWQKDVLEIVELAFHSGVAWAMRAAEIERIERELETRPSKARRAAVGSK
jgi:hypothetical protein